MRSAENCAKFTAVTRDTYPLPNIKDCIEKMDGVKFWSTMDAASAYWAVQLKEADKEKTAFSVPRGKYEFNVMLFGLSNAGATYQRLMADMPVRSSYGTYGDIFR